MLVDRNEKQYRVSVHRKSDQVYICAMYDKRKLDEIEIEKVANQATLLWKLDHENLCRLECIFEDEKRINLVF